MTSTPATRLTALKFAASRDAEISAHTGRTWFVSIARISLSMLVARVLCNFRWNQGGYLNVRLAMTTRRKFLAQACLASAAVALRAQSKSSFDATMQAYVEKVKFEGVLLLSRGPRIVMQKAFGVANR